MTALERLEEAVVAYGVAAVNMEEIANELKLNDQELSAVSFSAIAIERVKRSQAEQG